MSKESTGGKIPDSAAGVQPEVNAAAKGPQVAGLAAGMIQREDGLFLDRSDADFRRHFEEAVDHIFSAGKYFSGLDYRRFIKLLYGVGPSVDNPKHPHEPVRFAARIMDFDQERRSLYKSVKVENGQAEYYFEPVFLASGRASATPETLSFDEFVAEMWNREIRFGIDAELVHSAIDEGKSERLVIASRLPGIPGQDATLLELSEEIHRDDAPRQLAGGRVELQRFKNRFPQMKKGVRLVKKVPRVPGSEGFELSGEVIEPEIPADLDLAALVGPGTRLEHFKDLECIVTTEDGFLNLDSVTNQISITQKIVGREGVSCRTTGDLLLTGDEYEEYGEIQEKRLIEGNNITIHADVFGNVSSRGGSIVMDSNLVGGTAINLNGNISLKGIASGATLQTKNGHIVINRAESCVIAGTQVTIDHATNCDIIAEQVTIKHAEGCKIAGRMIDIELASPRKQNEMLLYVLIPDREGLLHDLDALRHKIDETSRVRADTERELEKVRAQPELQTYITLAAKVKKKELILTPDQTVKFQKMAASVAPFLRLAGQYNLDIRKTETDKALLLNQITALEAKQKESEAGIHCLIAKISGEASVRTMKFKPGELPWSDLGAKDVRARLHSAQENQQVIFSGIDGKVSWVPTGMNE